MMRKGILTQPISFVLKWEIMFSLTISYTLVVSWEVHSEFRGMLNHLQITNEHFKLSFTMILQFMNSYETFKLLQIL